MCKRKKKYMVAFFSILILCLIIMLPQIYFSVMDSYAYQRAHKMKNITFSLSSDVKDIAMVSRLHELLNSYYYEGDNENVFLIQGNQENQIIEFTFLPVTAKEMKSILKKAGLLQYIDSKIFEEMEYCTKVLYGEEVVQYSLKGAGRELYLKYDNKTQKLYDVKYQGKGVGEIQDDEIYDLERKYIDYLNLSLVEDWNYNDKKMVSKKAHLSLEMSVAKRKNAFRLSWKLSDEN